MCKLNRFGFQTILIHASLPCHTYGPVCVRGERGPSACPDKLRLVQPFIQLYHQPASKFGKQLGIYLCSKVGLFFLTGSLKMFSQNQLRQILLLLVRKLASARAAAGRGF